MLKVLGKEENQQLEQFIIQELVLQKLLILLHYHTMDVAHQKKEEFKI